MILIDGLTLAKLGLKFNLIFFLLKLPICKAVEFVLVLKFVFALFFNNNLTVSVRPCSHANHQMLI